MAVQRTPEQEAVVKNRGGALLVSAAAGSGKTRVLVERLLDRILNEGKNIDQFLIITFTRAAAEELRARIAGELAEALRAQPDNTHLRRQTVLVYKAQISTIHAFCTVLLRQWGHLLDLPADFALCEDEDSAVLMKRTLDRVLEARYEEVDPEGTFAALLDVLTAGRDDSRLMDIVLDVFGKIQSDADPLCWLEEQRKTLDLSGVTDVGQTPWGALLLEDAAQTAAYWAGQMEKALDLARRDEALERAYGDSLSVTASCLRSLADAAGESWDAASGLSVEFPKFKGARGVQDHEAQEQIKAIRTRCKKAVESLTASLSGTSSDLLSDLALVAPAMEGLIDLVEDFSAAYAQEKSKRSLLDFSDLEHYAVKLLVAPDGTPTEVARQWGSQYAEIMVDEYQDTNQVQNAIFNALSDQGRNLFMVGDVKQSIYRFRLADPTIFLEKYRSYAPWTCAEEGEPRTITMSKNFRSRPQVLEAANDLFRAIMSRRLGEMEYTEAEALYPGGTFPAGEGYETELHVLDFSDDPALTEDKENKNFLEARFTARRIAALLEAGFPVADGQGGTRPLKPEDIAILLRSPGPVRSYYTLALEEQGIAWSAEEGSDFFETTEISSALSWLQIIDNPRQDIPLLAALRSPVWGFDGDKLAEIRRWYDGYRFAGCEIYNPWSVINYFDSGCEPQPYWVNTSGNSILGEMLRHSRSRILEKLETVLQGEAIETRVREDVIYSDIYKNESALYTMLVTTGYLTTERVEQNDLGMRAALILPNRELQSLFRSEVLDRYHSDDMDIEVTDMMQAFADGDIETVRDGLSEYLEVLTSTFDAQKGKESFYHGFVLGLTATLIGDYQIRSNRESGYGRYDIAAFPRGAGERGFVIECKTAEKEEIQVEAKAALQQIADRDYDAEFRAQGVTSVLHYGIAFHGKRVWVEFGNVRI